MEIKMFAKIIVSVIESLESIVDEDYSLEEKCEIYFSCINKLKLAAAGLLFVTMIENCTEDIEEE